MSFEFDIYKTPPGQKEIDSVREQARQEYDAVWKRMKPFVVGAAVALALLLVFQFTIMIPYIADPGANRTILAIVGIFIPYMAFLVFVISNNARHRFIENPRKAAKATIDGLEPASDAELAELAELLSEGDEYRDIAAYKARVDVLGRRMVKGELDAIERWLDKREAEQKAAARAARIEARKKARAAAAGQTVS